MAKTNNRKITINPVKIANRNRDVGRIMIAVVFILLTTFILPRSSVSLIKYNLGKAWELAALKAPFDFPVLKPTNDYQRQVREAKDEVPLVFLQVENHVQTRREKARAYFEQLREVQNKLRNKSRTDWARVKPLARQAAEKLSPTPDLAQLNAIWMGDANLQTLEQTSLRALEEIYSQPYIDRKISDIKNPFISLRKTPSSERMVEARQLTDGEKALRIIQRYTQNLSEEMQELVSQLLIDIATPDYRFTAQLYNEEREIAEQRVNPYFGIIEKGEVIVQYKQVVTPNAARQIDSLNEALNERSENTNVWLRFGGQMAVITLLTLIILQFLRINRQQIYYRVRQLFLLFLIYFSVIGLGILVLYLTEDIASAYALDPSLAVPLSMVAILTTVFFDDRTGFFSNILAALVLSMAVQNNFEFFLVHATAGSFAVFNLTFLRNRGQFFVVSGYLLMVYTVTYLGYNLYLSGDLLKINYYNLGLILLNVFFTLGTYPLIYIFERVFKVTSNLTYMELMDTDHPLLKEMSVKAPGTYQHSLQVANIAESVAKKVNANPILVHAGALFHDIGKTAKPGFFIENSTPEENPHNNITALESARVIISHVTEGEKLAKKHGLPPEIIDFIRTHHGDSRVEFFYQKHLKQHPEAKPEIEEDFRYPGPRPSSKEEAILMIADSVEAAARTIKQPTKEKIEQLVERIVQGKVVDDQLAHARITFRDLNKIKREVLNLMLSIYHGRITYPDQDDGKLDADELAAAESTG
ncbi:MAG: HD family phosphohydrolase [Bacteroidota bacterium]